MLKQSITVLVATLGTLWFVLVWGGFSRRGEAQQKDSIPALVRDGSPKAISTLYRLFRSGQPGMFAKASNGIIQVAERFFLQGKKKQARHHANNLWLSSSPHSVRMRAWKIMFLVESQFQRRESRSTVVLRAPGARNHRRFSHWLNATFVQKHSWLLQLKVRYVPVLVSPGRGGEDAWITFVLSAAKHKASLLRLLRQPGTKYPTQRWKIVSEVSLHQRRR